LIRVGTLILDKKFLLEGKRMARYPTKRKPTPRPKQNLLPLWLSLFGLIIVVIAAWALISNNARTKSNVSGNGEARLKVEETVIDHGNVKLGTPVRDDIRVTNVGDQPLRFTEAPYIEILEGC
jgi:hypothetical protein